MAPPFLLVPLLLLAAAATVIASQSIISGAFSVTQQAVQLGYLPRLVVRHTSAKERGQVYAPVINAMLFVAVVGIVLAFRSSAALAAAFGLAVTATMVLTTLMIGFVIFRVWRWNPLWAVPLYGVLLALDLGLFAASSTKFAEGGWLPVTVAAALMTVFATWHRGRQLMTAKIGADAMPIDIFLKSTAHVHRVPSTAIYLTTLRDGVPPALLHNLKANQVRHERILFVTVETALTPYVAAAERGTKSELSDGVSRIVIRYGFFESPDIPAALRAMGVSDAGATYFLSRQTLVPTRKPGMARWRERLFSAMVRNAEQPMTFFCLPINRVVELGSQVEI